MASNGFPAIAELNGLLQTLITTKVENYATVEEWINVIMSTANKLNGIGFVVNDEWIGTLLLAGLPDVYNLMIMEIESSGIKITGDAIKEKLLQDVKVISASDSNAFNSSKHGTGEHNQKRGFYCYRCDCYGHISAECEKKKNTYDDSHTSNVDNTKILQSNYGFYADFSSGFVSKDHLNQSAAPDINKTNSQKSNGGFCADVSCDLVDKCDLVTEIRSVYGELMNIHSV